MLSILKSVERSPLISCRRVIANNIRPSRRCFKMQPAYSSSSPLLTGRSFPSKQNGGAKRRSLCTWIDSSQEIKSLKRQRLFWFGFALAAPLATYLYLKSAFQTHSLAAMMAASLDDASFMPYQRGLYEIIASNPDIMAKIGPKMGFGRPYYCDADGKSATMRLPVFNEGKCVGQAHVKIPVPGERSSAGSLASNGKASLSDSDLDPLFGWQVVLLLGNKLIKVPVPSLKDRGYNMDETRDRGNLDEAGRGDVGTEFELELEQVDEAAFKDGDDKGSNT